MRLNLPCFLLCFTHLAALADEPAVHTIAADGSQNPAGIPARAPHFLAIGGKPIRIIWKDGTATASASLVVDRITDARRVPLTTATATATEGEWRWDWSPPVTRGVATYEIIIKKEGIPPVRIEVRDPDEYLDLEKTLKSMEWEASGLEQKEADALAALGFRLRTLATASNQAPPLLRMISSGQTKSRRTVTWDNTQHHLVVWRTLSSAGDIDIRAPHWWISAEALATDEGRIRLFDLFSTSPVSH